MYAKTNHCQPITPPEIDGMTQMYIDSGLLWLALVACSGALQMKYMSSICLVSM